jgi:hypothetical protein
VVAEPQPLLEEQIAMGTPERSRVIRIKVFRRWNITTGAIALHFPLQPPNVVFGMAKMHELTLIWRLKNGVPHLLSMG